MEREIDIQILLAGKGTRLLRVTKGESHKSLVSLTDSGLTALDIITTEIMNLNLGRVVYSLSQSEEKHGKQIYSFLRKSKYPVECILEREGMQIGSAGAVELFNKYGSSKKPILVLCGDMVYEWSEMKKFVDFHKPRTISWFTSSIKTPFMQKYFGLVSNKRNEILGDIKLNWNSSTKNKKILMKGGAIMVDRELFKTMFQNYVDFTGKTDIDLFWDLLPYIEMVNRKNVHYKLPSILNAYDSRGIILDTGTPELLSYTKEYLKNVGRYN